MPERRSALSEVLRPGLSGAESAPGPGVTIAALAPLALVQVAAFDLPRAEAALGAAFGLAPPERNRAAEAGERRLLWCGAERWLAVEPETRDLASQLRAALPSDVAAVTDLSHARTVLRLEGSAVRTLLAKLGQLDFDPAAFATGATAQTQLAQIGALLHARGDAVEVMVYRGFAVSAFEMLVDAALEFGCRVR